MRTRLILAAAWAGAFSQAAGEDLLSSVNWARARGCALVAAPLPLQENSKLRKAAGRVAAGAALRDALAAEGYTAAKSSELHFSGAVGTAAISRALTAGFCRTLSDPELREMGAVSRGGSVWLLLAAPAVLPSSKDAAAVSGRVLERVNAARAAGRRCGANYFPPAPPLKLNSSLNRAALAHSQDMAKYGRFDHRGHDGSTPQKRVELAGFGAYGIVGENIAAGAMTASEVTSGWLASAAHCENIMDGRFSEMGLGYAADAKGEAGMYWTQDFAAPR